MLYFCLVYLSSPPRFTLHTAPPPTVQATTPCPYFLASGTANSQQVAPRLSYAAPEVSAGSVAGGAPAGLNTSADMFSLGLLMAELFRGPTRPTGATDPILSCGDASPFRHRETLAQLGPAIQAMLPSLPPAAAQAVSSMLNPNPGMRPDPNQILSNPIFHQPGVSMLRRIDTLPVCGAHASLFPPRCLCWRLCTCTHMLPIPLTRVPIPGPQALAKRDPASVSSFLSGQLPQSLQSVEPPRLRRECVLPQVLGAGKANPALWPFVLPIVFSVVTDTAEPISAPQFTESFPTGTGIAEALISPGAPLMKLDPKQQRNPQVVNSDNQALLVCLQNSDSLMKLATREWLAEYLNPALLRALATPQVPRTSPT